MPLCRAKMLKVQAHKLHAMNWSPDIIVAASQWGLCVHMKAVGAAWSTWEMVRELSGTA